MDLLKKVEDERELLASGRKPEPRFKHAVQRAAARGLAIFLILMLALTLLSRAADGITVARVEVQEPKTGVLTQRININGTIEAQGDLELTLPAGIRVTKVNVSKGQSVQMGDVLLELDQDAINSAIEKLKNDIALLNLKISNTAGGGSGASADAIANARAALDAAQQAVVNAQEDYDRLVEGRAGTEERAKEDEAQAKADYEAAVAALEKAKTKAKTELVKTAQDKVDTAKTALEDVKTATQDAVDSAQSAVESAQDQESSVDSSYYAAISAYNRADEAVKRAQNDYNAAIGTEGEAAALAALNQAISARDQASATMDSLSDQSSNAGRAVKRAKEALKTAQEKQKEKVEKAEKELKTAEDKLLEAQNKTDMSEETLVISAQAALDSAERAVKTAQRGTEDAGTATQDQLLAAQRAIETAQRGVDSAQRTLDQAGDAAERERLTNQNTRGQSEIERLGYVNERREKQKQLDSLSAVADAGGRLLSPIAGTVMEIMEDTGLTQEGAKVASLSRSDQGFEFTGKVSGKEAEKLTVGDEANLTYTKDNKSQNAPVTITSIGTADEKGDVEIKASLPEGNWPTGVSAKAEVSKRSQQYNSVLPLGALRSDGSDNFVLVLREKSTVMGTEQTVEKLPVDVLEKDSEQMAIQDGMIPYGEKIVVSAGKPVSEGDRVRVEEKK